MFVCKRRAQISCVAARPGLDDGRPGSLAALLNPGWSAQNRVEWTCSTMTLASAVMPIHFRLWAGPLAGPFTLSPVKAHLVIAISRIPEISDGSPVPGSRRAPCPAVHLTQSHKAAAAEIQALRRATATQNSNSVGCHFRRLAPLSHVSSVQQLLDPLNGPIQPCSCDSWPVPASARLGWAAQREETDIARSKTSTGSTKWDCFRTPTLLQRGTFYVRQPGRGEVSRDKILRRKSFSRNPTAVTTSPPMDEDPPQKPKHCEVVVPCPDRPGQSPPDPCATRQHSPFRAWRRCVPSR